MILLVVLKVGLEKNLRILFGESVKEWLEIKACQDWRGSPEWLVSLSFLRFGIPL